MKRQDDQTWQDVSGKQRHGSIGLKYITTDFQSLIQTWRLWFRIGFTWMLYHFKSDQNKSYHVTEYHVKSQQNKSDESHQASCKIFHSTSNFSISLRFHWRRSGLLSPEQNGPHPVEQSRKGLSKAIPGQALQVERTGLLPGCWSFSEAFSGTLWTGSIWNQSPGRQLKQFERWGLYEWLLRFKPF